MKAFIKYTFLLTLFSCHTNPKKIILNGKRIDTDTIQFFSVSEDYKQKDRRFNSLLGLDSLEKTGHPLEIRIIHYWLNTSRLFVIKQVAGIWSGYTVAVTPEINEKNNSMRYVPEILGHPPKYGWDSLGKQLLSMGILEIPITGGSSTDMDAVFVEYISKDGYRQYSVDEPEVQKSSGGKRMYQIIQLIEKELEFKNFATDPYKSKKH